MDIEKGKELRRVYNRLYQREYRKRNKEKIAEYNRQWWARQAVEVRSLPLEVLEAELEQLKSKAW